MNTYRITYKKAMPALPDTVRAATYRIVGRFFIFYDDEMLLEAETVATISADLVAYIATD
jgi:hypothetical protein